jgi:hypothetical protein
MSSPSSGRSPLARLVLFIVCLSIAGGIVAGAHWYVIDAPQQNALLQPPTNTDTCEGACHMQSNDCVKSCVFGSNWETCVDGCTNTYYECTCRYCQLYC